jgi:hypothetical protein
MSIGAAHIMFSFIASVFFKENGCVFIKEATTAALHLQSF